MEILFNNEGTPLAMTSRVMFGESTGRPENYERKKKQVLSPYSLEKVRTLRYRNLEVMTWGRNNKFPETAIETISSTSVLNTGLKFLRALTVGQGIMACRVKGYKDNGDELLEAVDDSQVRRFVGGRMVRRYLEKASRDYFKVGSAAVEMMVNAAGDIVGLNPLNALFYRYTLPDAYGACKCVVSGDWPNMPGRRDLNPKVLDVLMDYDPGLHVEWMRAKGRLRRSFVFPVRDSWSNNDYYGEPVWLPAYILGWVEVAHMVPKFLQKAYKNQITWKWHVQIPYSFWDRKYPPQDFETPKLRTAAIQKYMDEVEENLCGLQNAEKPLFTHYNVNEANGKIEEEWKITALDNKYKGGENLVTSAAANSEILFALMVNPNVFGAGMPGGTYAGNQGGSNIREAFLVNLANAYIDRQNLLDPVNLYLEAHGVKDVELRFRNTILTTLDTGAGTQKTLS